MSAATTTKSIAFVVFNLKYGRLARELPRPRAASAKPAIFGEKRKERKRNKLFMMMMMGTAKVRGIGEGRGSQEIIVCCHNYLHVLCVSVVVVVVVIVGPCPKLHGLCDVLWEQKKLNSLALWPRFNFHSQPCKD